MADNPSKSSSSSRRPNGSASSSSSQASKGGFLTRKIFGIPLWVIVLAIVAIYYWYTHYGPGKPQPQQQKGGQGKGRRGGGTRIVIIDRRGHKRGHQNKHRRGGPDNTTPVGGGNVGGGMAYQATSVNPSDTGADVPAGGPVLTGGAPVYGAYQEYYGAQPLGGDGGQADVPEPVQAYAPMTAGAIYG